MSACSNCGARLTCGCQRRRAKDGKACCDKCVTTYNNSLNKPAQPNGPQAPTNVKATYNGPGKQL